MPSTNYMTGTYTGYVVDKIVTCSDISGSYATGVEYAIRAHRYPQVTFMVSGQRNRSVEGDAWDAFERGLNKNGMVEFHVVTVGGATTMGGEHVVTSLREITETYRQNNYGNIHLT